jgi:L-fuculose-phosphate aldolase
MNDHESMLRADLCEVAHRLYLDGFMSASEGNLSSLLNENEVLVTPTGICKGFLKPDQIVKMDRQGKQLSGDLPPTTEAAMHLAAYEERPQVKAVIHCHPPFLNAFSVAGLILPAGVLPEFEVLFGGNLPVAHYATPGTAALADSIRKIIHDPEHDLVILDHHGVLAVGQDANQAAIKIEYAESTARVIYYARQLGNVLPLPEAELAPLREMHQKMKNSENQLLRR